MKKNDKIYIAGHTGLVGSEVYKLFKTKGYKNLIIKNSKELDLTNQLSVNKFFKKKNIDIVILCAAKVGGIYANFTRPADFIYKNLMIQTNIINASFKYKCKKIIFLGSSCIYPRNARQPMKENYLLTGSLEPTNLAYAVAKISGLIMADSYNKQYKNKVDFRCLMPTNLYGNKDNYLNEDSHVIPALIRKFHNAKIENKKKIYLWGTGLSKREFLHSSDLANAILLITKVSKKKYKKIVKNNFNFLNIGCGVDYSIANLAKKLKKIIGYQGKIIFKNNKLLDGTPRKKLDIKLISKFGWKPKINLSKGLEMSYRYYVDNYT